MLKFYIEHPLKGHVRERKKERKKKREREKEREIIIT